MKDTVNKAPLMVHLVELVVEKFPDASDLYSDLPSVHRIAKVMWKLLQCMEHVDGRRLYFPNHSK